MNVKQLIQHLEQCEPTARVALVEPTGIAELTGLVQLGGLDVVLLSTALTGLILEVE